MIARSLLPSLLYLAGCNPCGGASCPTPHSLIPGPVAVGLPEDVGTNGVLDVQADDVQLQYTDPDGNTWLVTWIVAPPTP